MRPLPSAPRQEAERTIRALRSTAVVSGMGYAAQGISLFAIPLFLKTVGAEGYGLMVTVMAFMGYLNFADAGLSWGSMILIAQAHGRNDRNGIAHIVRHSAVLAVGSGVVVLLAVGVIVLLASHGWRLPMFSGHPEADRLVLIAGVQLVLTLQFSVTYNIFIGLQEVYWAGIYQGLGRILGLSGAMAAAWWTHDVSAMMLGQLVFTVLFGLAAALHAWRRHPWAFQTGHWMDWAQYEMQLRSGAKSLLLQIGRTFGGTAPTLGISTVLGPAFVPFYTVPCTLLSLFFTPINTWNANLQSAYGEAWASGDNAWVRGTFRRSLERALLLGALGVVLFLLLGDGFVQWWTHARLNVGPATAVSVSLVVMTSAWLAAGQYLLAGLNRHRQAALAELGNGLLAVLFVMLALRLWGLGGVGGGVVLAAAVTSGWLLRREIHRQIGPDSFPAPSYILRVGLVVLASCAAAWLFHPVATMGVGPAAFGRLLLEAAIGLTVFLLASVGLKLFTLREVASFGGMLKEQLILPTI